jgi:hypothetical protein
MMQMQMHMAFEAWTLASPLGIEFTLALLLRCDRDGDGDGDGDGVMQLCIQ